MELSNLTDEELFFSVGSFRPYKGDLGEMLGRNRTDEQLKDEQDKFDAAIAEMRRRHKISPFPFYIPGERE